MANLTSNAIARLDEYCKKGIPCSCGTPIVGLNLGQAIAQVARLADTPTKTPSLSPSWMDRRLKYPAPQRQFVGRHGDGVIHTDDLFKLTPRLLHTDFMQRCAEKPKDGTLIVMMLSVVCPYCSHIQRALSARNFDQTNSGMCERCRRDFKIPAYKA